MKLRLRTSVHAVTLIFVAIAICAAMPSSSAAAVAGSLDSSFGSGGFATTVYGTWAAAAADAVQPNGYVVTAGETDVNGTDEIIATRYTNTGQPDSGFGNGGIVTINIGGSAGVDSGAGIALQPDGKILIAGAGTAQGKLDFAVVRLNANGSPDPTFGQNGVVTLPIGSAAYATAVLLDRSGDIDVGGIAQMNGINHFAVARLTPSGTLDTSFGSGGVTVLPPYAAAWGMVLQPDGSLVLAGQELDNSHQVFVAARVLANGSPDPTFGNGGIVTIPIGSSAMGYAVALQPDGKIVIGGNATSSNGTALGAVVRLEPNGSLDPSFASGGILQFPGGGLNAMKIGGSGHIYLVGVGATVIRLNANGSVDTSFAQGGLGIYCPGTSCAANGVSIDPTSGNLVLAGIATVGGRPQVLVFRVSAPSGTEAPPATTSAVSQRGSLQLRRSKLVPERGTVRVALRCSSVQPCTGRVSIDHGWMRCVRSERFSIAPGASKTVKASVSGRCLRLVGNANHRKLRAKLVASLFTAQPTLTSHVLLISR